jgi:DNA-binding CsgD family transcriptional regulator
MVTLVNMGQIAEAIQEGRRSLAVAREVGYPTGEVMALNNLSCAAGVAGDVGSAVQWARQAAQITDGIPGSLARTCSDTLAEALTLAGDLAEAGRVCAAGLDQSREMGDVQNLTVFLLVRGVLDLRTGSTDAAAAHFNETIQLGLRGDHRFFVLNTVECCGDLCAQTGRAAEALTLWAAADALLPQGIGNWFEYSLHPRRHEWVSQAQHALGPAGARAAEERGAAMSLATAAEFALMLTTPSPQRSAVSPGLGNLSARERELVTLVAQRHTDAQIAAQLHISIRTVTSHLDRIRDKTGCRRRADLTRLALGAGLV